MRIADTIDHPKMRVIIHTLDQFYYVEAEAGVMKQGYKFKKEAFGGLQGLKIWVAEKLSPIMVKNFEQMYAGVMEVYPKN